MNPDIEHLVLNGRRCSLATFKQLPELTLEEWDAYADDEGIIPVPFEQRLNYRVGYVTYPWNLLPGECWLLVACCETLHRIRASAEYYSYPIPSVPHLYITG